MQETSSTPLLSICNLRVSFAAETGPVCVLDGINLRVPRGKTVALVGESGCGKSVTALSILRLLPGAPTCIRSGEILFHEAPGQQQVDLFTLPERALRRIRGNRIAVVFQEVQSALNPVFSVGMQIIEAITLHRGLKGQPARDLAVDLLDRVGIPAARQRMNDFPHQLSGGMRQRVMIAMALAGAPDLLIAAEPTTALDVTIQLQILDLLKELQREAGRSLLLITHDFGVVADIADEVYVMYAGRIVEHGPTPTILTTPAHPYTKALLRCTPRLSWDAGALEVIPGQVPRPAHPPSGCRFHPRCALTRSAALASTAARTFSGDGADTILRRCVEEYSGEPSGTPTLRLLHPDHFVACWEAAP